MMRFLDTRGLGETAYDPGEDLAWCANQAHLLVVVLRALDMNQAEVVNTVAGHSCPTPGLAYHRGANRLARRLAGDAEHIQPYPYNTRPFRRKCLMLWRKRCCINATGLSQCRAFCAGRFHAAGRWF